MFDFLVKSSDVIRQFQNTLWVPNTGRGCSVQYRVVTCIECGPSVGLGGGGWALRGGGRFLYSGMSATWFG